MARGEGFEVVDVRCYEPDQGWSAPEIADGYALVFVRSGRFVRRVGRQERFLDATSSYFELPGREQQIAHPGRSGDACTAIHLREELDEDVLDTLSQVRLDCQMLTPMDGAIAIQQVTRQVRDDQSALEETIIRLVTAALFGPAGLSSHAGRARASTDASHRRLIDDTRQILAVEPTVGLVELARRLLVSPHHLSRIFHTRTGKTISAYRNELRVREALDRLGEGEPSLTELANDLGFADHAHLTRVVRRMTGVAPATIRRLLARDQSVDS